MFLIQYQRCLCTMYMLFVSLYMHNTVDVLSILCEMNESQAFTSNSHRSEHTIEWQGAIFA